MPQSVFEAIQLGIWDFEPEERDTARYEATKALPGTREKLEVLARRIRQGLPLWHPRDRCSYEDVGME